MVVYILRHGESTANAEKILAGWAQVPLTEKGVDQARQTRPLLEGLSFTKVISSDLLRAVQTAQEALPGYEVQTDPRLREIHMGSLQGCNIAECSEPLRTYNFLPFGGEDIPAHIARVSQFMESMQDEPEDARIAVVCHAGTIYCMLCHVMQARVPREVSTVFNASVSAFSYKDGHWHLLKWNETGTTDLPEGTAY